MIFFAPNLKLFKPNLATYETNYTTFTWNCRNIIYFLPIFFTDNPKSWKCYIRATLDRSIKYAANSANLFELFLQSPSIQRHFLCFENIQISELSILFCAKYVLHFYQIYVCSTYVFTHLLKNLHLIHEKMY